MNWKKVVVSGLLGWYLMVPPTYAGDYVGDWACTQTYGEDCKVHACKSMAGDMSSIAVLHDQGASIGDLLKSNIDSREVSIFFKYRMDRLLSDEVYPRAYRMCMSVKDK